MKSQKKKKPDLPLAIVIAVLVKDNQLLLIKRKRGDYVGLMGLPGGKIEKNEHLSEAATREILEESGIKSVFKNHLGFVSEHLFENGEIIQHFLLHICQLEPETTELLNTQEGDLSWVELDKLSSIENKIIPSDFLIINKIVLNKEKEYYNCIVEKTGDSYTVKCFE